MKFAAGNFSTLWRPLPGEAGLYILAAAHPGDADPASQDSFSLYGMEASPKTLSLRVPEQSSVTNRIDVRNLGDLPLNGLVVSVVSNASSWPVTASLRTNTLTAETVSNPGADREHCFRAWRLKGESSESVCLRTRIAKEAKIEVVPDED